MDDRRRRGASHPERVHVRHHVVPHLEEGQHENSLLKLHLDDGNLPLLGSRLLEVDVVELASHLLQLLVGDVETKLLRSIISFVPFLFIAVILWQFCLKEKV